MTDSKDSSVQLEASKSSIKDLFKDLLDEIKGFKYQIIVKVLLKKHKQNGGIEFAPVHFNSTAKTAINSKCKLDKSFYETLYRTDNWINEKPGCIIESTNGEYVNILIHSPLSGSSYTELPNKLRNLMKGLINIKNNDNKWFLWTYKSIKTHPERITKAGKKMVNDYQGIKFPVSKKDYCKIKQKKQKCFLIHLLTLALHKRVLVCCS